MIPREHYLFQTGTEQVASEPGEKYELDIKESVRRGMMKQEPTPDGQGSILSLVPNNGIFFMIKGATFPLKCFPEAGVVFAINLIKAQIIEMVKLFSHWYLLPFIVLINKKKALESFNRLAMKSVSPYLLKDYCLTQFSREFKVLVFTFLSKLGFDKVESENFATIIANITDYDNLYRLRIQDALSETSKELLLKQPIREIWRQLKIIKNRENYVTIHYKFKAVAMFLTVALLFPKVRKAYKETINAIDLDKLQYDEVDRYWLCIRNDYKWMGLSNEERMQYAKEKGWKFPHATLLNNK